MDHSTAVKLMAIYERLGAVINEASHVISTLPDAERSDHARALCDMMGDLWCKLQLPVVREHRDLDPDGDLFQKKDS